MQVAAERVCDRSRAVLECLHVRELKRRVRQKVNEYVLLEGTTCTGEGDGDEIVIVAGVLQGQCERLRVLHRLEANDLCSDHDIEDFLSLEVDWLQVLTVLSNVERSNVQEPF